MATTTAAAAATTTLHLHADAANTAAHTSSQTSEYVSVPIDLRRLDQATAGPPSSMGVRSVVVTMSPNSERLARDTASDALQFHAGHVAYSTGQAVLDDNTNSKLQSSEHVGTNRFAKRFPFEAWSGGSDPAVGDSYCYEKDPTGGDAHKFGLLCNLGHSSIRSGGQPAGVVFVRFEHGGEDGGHVHVLKLGPDVAYRAYSHAVADGQQVQLDAHNATTDKTPFVLPSGIADANKIVDGTNKQPTTTSTALLYARNVAVPTHVAGEDARGARALMFFNTFADATADYDTPLGMASKAVDMGPTGFSAA